MNRKTVTLALLGSFLLLIAERGFKGEFPKPRIMIALSVAFLFVGIVAEYEPTFAAYFAILIFIAILLERGEFVLNSIVKSYKEVR